MSDFGAYNVDRSRRKVGCIMLHICSTHKPRVVRSVDQLPAILPEHHLVLQPSEHEEREPPRYRADDEEEARGALEQLLARSSEVLCFQEANLGWTPDPIHG